MNSQVQQLEFRQKQGPSPRGPSDYEQQQKQGCENDGNFAMAHAPSHRGASAGGARNEPPISREINHSEAPSHSEPRSEPLDKWSALEQHMNSGVPKTGGGYVPPHLRRMKGQEQGMVTPLPQQVVPQPADATVPREMARSAQSIIDLAVQLEFKEEHACALMSSGYDVNSLRTSTDDDLKRIGLPKGVRMKLLKWAN